jgi:hypothetical protein
MTLFINVASEEILSSCRAYIIKVIRIPTFSAGKKGNLLSNFFNEVCIILIPTLIMEFRNIRYKIINKRLTNKIQPYLQNKINT